MKQILPVCFACISLAGIAHGTILTSLEGTPVADGSNFDFNYMATLSGDERLDPAATAGATCPGSALPCDPPGTFFTIYDIPGFVSVSGVPVDWSYTAQLTGITPSTINAGAFDDPTLTNVTFSYTGDVVHANGVLVPFTGFQIVSNYGEVNPLGNFTSQATKDMGDSAGKTDQVVGLVGIPTGGEVPEPATLGLMGVGMIALSLLKFRRRRDQ